MQGAQAIRLECRPGEAPKRRESIGGGKKGTKAGSILCEVIWNIHGEVNRKPDACDKPSKLSIKGLYFVNFRPLRHCSTQRSIACGYGKEHSCD